METAEFSSPIDFLRACGLFGENTLPHLTPPYPVFLWVGCVGPGPDCSVVVFILIWKLGVDYTLVSFKVTVLLVLSE